MTRDWTGNRTSALAALAPSNHAKQGRAENDFYATEPKAVELLMGLEGFAPLIWEPACGAGHISSVLKKHGHDVRESDIVDRMGNEVLDFMGGGVGPETWDGDIVTNPPYAIAAEFVERALEVVRPGAKVAMFLKLTFLESSKRRRLFELHPPRRVWVSRSRLRCWPNGVPSNNALIAYAWFVWLKGWQGAPEIGWFN